MFITHSICSVVRTKKKDTSGKQKYRIVIEFRTLNKYTFQNLYPWSTKFLINSGPWSIFSIMLTDFTKYLFYQSMEN